MTEHPTTTPAARTTRPTAPADDSLELPQNFDQARKVRSENKTLRDRLKAARRVSLRGRPPRRPLHRSEVERSRRRPTSSTRPTCGPPTPT